MNGFFAKIDHFFAKIGKNCIPFDTFLALFGTFDRDLWFVNRESGVRGRGSGVRESK
jgi:hypothetical protein